MLRRGVAGVLSRWVSARAMAVGPYRAMSTVDGGDKAEAAGDAALEAEAKAKAKAAGAGVAPVEGKAAAKAKAKVKVVAKAEGAAGLSKSRQNAKLGTDAPARSDAGASAEASTPNSPPEPRVKHWNPFVFDYSVSEESESVAWELDLLKEKLRALRPNAPGSPRAGPSASGMPQSGSGTEAGGPRIDNVPVAKRSDRRVGRILPGKRPKPKARELRRGGVGSGRTPRITDFHPISDILRSFMDGSDLPRRGKGRGRGRWERLPQTIPRREVMPIHVTVIKAPAELEPPSPSTSDTFTVLMKRARFVQERLTQEEAAWQMYEASGPGRTRIPGRNPPPIDMRLSDRLFGGNSGQSQWAYATALNTAHLSDNEFASVFPAYNEWLDQAVEQPAE